MNSGIRWFALLVAVAGLASASLAPATTQAYSRHVPVIVSDPVASAYPMPAPCNQGICVQ